ncbi:MAG: dehydrogenase E1 component subunit alpha/beta [Armatimonadetes bacterium]|nr:dehydrogenase E1 component subunit alpha/beta [Armatimonadota bacterium]
MKDIDIKPNFTPRRLEFEPIPVYQYRGTLRDELGKTVTREESARLLEVMCLVRYFEEMIFDFKNGKYKPFEGFSYIGATHLSIGQEATAVGSISAIGGKDYITSTHRGHGHAISKGAFAIFEMNEGELRHFIGGTVPVTCSESRAGLVEKAMEVHLYRTMCELLGKEDGYCRGRGGSMHIADFYTGHLGANAIVGGSMAIGTGAGIGCDKLGNGRIVLCIFGDGAMSNGISVEAINMAAMAQFERGCPVIFLIENNQYAMTGQETQEVTGVDFLIRRSAGLSLDNMHAELVNGMDVLAVRDAISRAAALCRSYEGPVMIECSTYRYFGHSLSDQRTTYRSQDEEAAWKACDPIQGYKQQVIEAGVMTAGEVESLDARCREAIRRAADTAACSADPKISQITEGLLSNTIAEVVPEEFRTTTVYKEPRKPRRDSEGRILFRHAVNEALMEEMLRDRRVVLYGEDLADYGGAFQVTVGLLDIFGRDRVWNSAISEAAIPGSAAGAAMVGLRPVVELMYIDFILMAMDQVGNQVAKTKFMFGGKCAIPMVLRTTIGGGKGYAGQHSQSLEAVAAHFPGLKVVAPSTPYDAKGLLKMAIRDDDPVVFIEHQSLYVDKGAVPEEEYLVPFGVANILREGTDITIVAYSFMAKVALQAADMLAAEHGVSAEVVDPRTLYPFDAETIVNSAKKTGHMISVTQSPLVCSFAEHIAYETQRRAFHALKSPVEIIPAYSIPPPMSQVLEQENLPNPAKIAQTALRMLGKA